ncbi:hypothetical protein ACWDCL_02025 [Streptomyces sp. NPDC001009]
MTRPARAGTGIVPHLDDDQPDVEMFAETTDRALGHNMSTTTRAQIDALTPLLLGHLGALLEEDLGADEDDEVRAMFREAYKLLELSNRPTPRTPAFGAFIFMRNVASLTRRFLWLYTQRNGLDAP